MMCASLVSVLGKERDFIVSFTLKGLTGSTLVGAWVLLWGNRSAREVFPVVCRVDRRP